MDVLNDVRPQRRSKSYADLVRCIRWYKENGLSKIVYPGKGLSNSEIRSRIRNKSLKVGIDGLFFNEEKEVTDVLKMSKIDAMRSHANEMPKLAEKKADIEKRTKAKGNE